MTDTTTRILLLPLMAYAALGLVLSLAVHVLALTGLQPGGNAVFVGLHVGIFPLWLPVILIARKLAGPKQLTRLADWNAVLSDCPAWMRYMTYAFFVYAIVNFVVFMFIVIFIAPPGPMQPGAGPPAPVWRGFSGHWMAFYSAGLAVVATAYRRGLSNLARKCPNGHVVGLGDRFCATCGVPIDGRPFAPRDAWRR
jgi:hypothetical protein